MNEIKLIDDHIFKMAAPEEALLFDAFLILDPGLPDKILWQKNVHKAVLQYSRKKLKTEIESVHQKLFSEPVHQSFRQRILGMFSLNS